MSVIATYLRDAPPALVLVKLQRFVGQRYGNHEDEVSKKVTEKARAILEEIEKAVKEQNIEALVVIDAQQRLCGVVAREQILSTMMLSLVR